MGLTQSASSFCTSTAGKLGFVLADDNCDGAFEPNRSPGCGKTAGLLFDHCMKRISVLCRPGSDLLFQALGLSTIGAEDFDGRVRDGIGYRLLAMTTRPAKDGILKQAVFSSRLGTTI